jgi:hypothetical protein
MTTNVIAMFKLKSCKKEMWRRQISAKVGVVAQYFASLVNSFIIAQQRKIVDLLLAAAPSLSTGDLIKVSIPSPRRTASSHLTLLSLVLPCRWHDLINCVNTYSIEVTSSNSIIDVVVEEDI